MRYWVVALNSHASGEMRDRAAIAEFYGEADVHMEFIVRNFARTYSHLIRGEVQVITHNGDYGWNPEEHIIARYFDQNEVPDESHV